MATYAGKDAVLRVHGTSTVMTDEPMEQVVGARWCMETGYPAKTCWDPAVAIVVTADGSAVPAAEIVSIDYLHGEITFSSDRTGETILVSGAYYPRLPLLKVTSVDIDWGAAELSTDSYGEDAGSAIAGPQQLSGTVEVLEELTTDLDGGGDTRTLSGLIESGADLILDWERGGRALRAWVHVSPVKQRADFGGVVGATLTVRGVTKIATSPIRQQVTYSWADV